MALMNHLAAKADQSAKVKPLGPNDEVCCQGFHMGDMPMYKPLPVAHSKARRVDGMCDGCKKYEQCQPPKPLPRESAH